MAPKNGAKDLWPETLTIYGKMSAADTDIVGSIPTNLGQAAGSTSGRVMEIVKIIIYFPNALTDNNGATYSCALGVSEFEQTDAFVDDAKKPTLIDGFSIYTTASAGGFISKTMQRHELVPGGESGRGYLVGSDRLYYAFRSASTSVANEYILRVFFKIRTVPLTEWVGIVQSQTGAY